MAARAAGQAAGGHGIENTIAFKRSQARPGCNKPFTVSPSPATTIPLPLVGGLQHTVFLGHLGMRAGTLRGCKARAVVIPDHQLLVLNSDDV